MTRIAIEHTGLISHDEPREPDHPRRSGGGEGARYRRRRAPRCTTESVPGCDTVIDTTREDTAARTDQLAYSSVHHGRTIGPERRLLKWLDLLMPVMAAIDAEALYIAELLGCVENIKNGNTSLVENIFMPPPAQPPIPRTQLSARFLTAGSEVPSHAPPRHATSIRGFARPRWSRRSTIWNSVPHWRTDPREVVCVYPSVRFYPGSWTRAELRERVASHRENGLAPSHARGQVA